MNIFDRITKRNEDSTTFLLVNLLNAKYIQDLFFEYLGIDRELIEELTWENISTQSTIENIGRPDIVVESDKCLIFIENKISSNTILQPTQTTTYLQKLNESLKKYKKMVYLLPDNYTHINDINGINDKNVNIGIIYWSDLLQYFNKKNINHWNSVVDQSLKHLEEVILQKEISLNLSREELVIMLTPHYFIAANSLFLKIKTFLLNIDEAILKDLDERFSPARMAWMETDNEMGKYINYNNQEDIFVGFNLCTSNSTENNHEDYFFSLDIYSDIFNKEKANKNKINYILNNGWYYIKLDKMNYTNFENPKELIKEIVLKIRNCV